MWPFMSLSLTVLLCFERLFPLGISVMLLKAQIWISLLEMWFSFPLSVWTKVHMSLYTLQFWQWYVLVYVTYSITADLRISDAKVRGRGGLGLSLRASPGPVSLILRYVLQFWVLRNQSFLFNFLVYCNLTS